jgi:hypothetical protein
MSKPIEPLLLTSKVTDPDLPIRGLSRSLTFLEGFYWRTDFRLVGGTILHDYLVSTPAAD